MKLVLYLALFVALAASQNCPAHFRTTAPDCAYALETMYTDRASAGSGRTFQSGSCCSTSTFSPVAGATSCIAAAVCSLKGTTVFGEYDPDAVFDCARANEYFIPLSQSTSSCKAGPLTTAGKCAGVDVARFWQVYDKGVNGQVINYVDSGVGGWFQYNDWDWSGTLSQFAVIVQSIPEPDDCYTESIRKLTIDWNAVFTLVGNSCSSSDTGAVVEIYEDENTKLNDYNLLACSA